MAERAIVFIDGNNLYHTLRASQIPPQDIDLEKLSDFVCRRFGCTREKSVYYNSIPNIRDSESVYYHHMEFLDRVRRLNRFTVKTRKLQRLSMKEQLQAVERELGNLDLCEMCSPPVRKHWRDYIGRMQVKEKGIDVMIAVDMIVSTLITKECERAILVSGDADFIPAMDVIRGQRKRVCSACVAKGYSFELRQRHEWFILDRAALLRICASAA